jgi:hypothetical protein
MIELVEGYRFIDTTLRANTPFMTSIPGGLYRVVQTKFPSGVFPDSLYCTYTYQGGSDEVGGGGIRIGVAGVYLCTVTGPGDQLDAIASASSAMDALLHGASGTTSTGTIYYLLRQSDYEQNTTVDTRLVTRLGGKYRAFLQRTGS